MSFKFFDYFNRQNKNIGMDNKSNVKNSNIKKSMSTGTDTDINININIEEIKRNNIKVIKNIFETIKKNICANLDSIDNISSDTIYLEGDKKILIKISDDTVICYIYGRVYSFTYDKLYILGEKNECFAIYHTHEQSQFYLDENDDLLSLLCENLEPLVSNILKKTRTITDNYNSLKSLNEDLKNNESKYLDFIQNFNTKHANLEIAVSKHDKLKKQNIKMIEEVLNQFSYIFKDKHICSNNIYIEDNNNNNFVTINYNPCSEKDTCIIVFNDYDSYFLHTAYYVTGYKNKSNWAIINHKLSEIDDIKFNFVIQNFNLFVKSLLIEAKKIEPSFDNAEFIRSMLK